MTYMEHELIVLKEPQHTSITESTPIDPAPIIQHRAFDPSTPRYRDPNQIIATYTVSASLTKPDDDVELRYLQDGRRLYLTGTLAISLQHFTDVERDNEIVASFVFSDLRVNATGSFRLKFRLFQTVEDNPMTPRKTTYSAPFHVYPVGRFPELGDPTPLSRSLVDPGVKFRFRADEWRTGRESEKQNYRGRFEDAPDAILDGPEPGRSDQILPPRPPPSTPVGPALGVSGADFEPPQVISPPLLPGDEQPGVEAEIPWSSVRDDEMGDGGGYHPCDPPQSASHRENWSMNYPPWHAPGRSGVRSWGDQDLAIRLSADQLPLPASGGDTPSAAVSVSSHSGFLSNSQPNIGSGIFSDISGSQYIISNFGERRSVTPSIQQSSSNDVPSSTQLLESAQELSGTLQAQHPAIHNTTPALQSEASSTLEPLVQATQIQTQSSAHEVALTRREQLEARPLPPQELAQECKSLMQMLNEWKDNDGQWNAVKEEWSQECERLSEARGERQLNSSDTSKSEHPDPPEDWHPLGASTAVGVLVLSVAAATVLWPE